MPQFLLSLSMLLLANQAPSGEAFQLVYRDGSEEFFVGSSKVELFDPSTSKQVVVFQGDTDSFGRIRVDLPAGNYLGVVTYRRTRWRVTFVLDESVTMKRLVVNVTEAVPSPTVASASDILLDLPPLRPQRILRVEGSFGDLFVYVGNLSGMPGTGNVYLVAMDAFVFEERVFQQTGRAFSEDIPEELFLRALENIRGPNAIWFRFKDQPGRVEVDQNGLTFSFVSLMRDSSDAEQVRLIAELRGPGVESGLAAGEFEGTVRQVDEENHSFRLNMLRQDFFVVDGVTDFTGDFDSAVDGFAYLRHEKPRISVEASLGPDGTLVASEINIHGEPYLYGRPTGAPDGNDFVVRDIYALSSNPETKFADWVTYRVSLDTMEGPSVSRNWRADPFLHPDRTLEPSDYRGANAALGTDRGHQAPLGSFRGTGYAHETNFMSNITAQMSDLNQGPWVRLEAAVRRVAQDRMVYVMTGPLYERNMPRLPEADEAHTLPSGYWKIVATEEVGGDLGVAAFVMDQEEARGSDFCTLRVSVEEIQSRASLDFFWMMESTAQEVLERAVAMPLASQLGCS